MVLSRIVKVCHSIVMVCHGCHGFVMSLSWFVMVRHGLSRFVIKLSWFVTVTNRDKKRAFLTMTKKVCIVWSKRALFFDFPVSRLKGIFDERSVTKRAKWHKLFFTMTKRDKACCHDFWS